MRCPKDKRTRLALAAAVMVALSACGGGGSMPVSPMGGDTFMQLDAPVSHGLAPLAQIELQSGTSEEHGNAVVSCPAEGPDCALRVAADGSIEYESAGGLPSVSLLTFTAEEVAGFLRDTRRIGSGPALVWHGARFPVPGAVTCAALLIGCEGGLGPIHYGSAKDFDVSGFAFLERRNDVSLAEKTVIADDTGRPSYRAFAGWMDHSFYLIETPRYGVLPGGAAPDHLYYRALSAGNVTGSDPNLSSGGTATWSGVMWGLILLEPDLSEPDAFVHGDATVTVSSHRGSTDLTVDVEFTDIRHKSSGAEFDDMRWMNLPLQSGSFGTNPVSADAAESSRHPASYGVSGRFYGPNHEEAGGLFGRREVMLNDHAATGVRAEVSGAFGVRRD